MASGERGLLRLRPKSATAPPFPNIAQLPTWTSALARSLVAASVALPVDREEARWFKETESKTFEQLSDSGDERFHHLGALLAESPMEVLPRGLSTMVQQNSCITGRQALRVVYGWLRTGERVSVTRGHAGLIENSMDGRSCHRRTEVPQCLGQCSRQLARGTL